MCKIEAIFKAGLPTDTQFSADSDRDEIPMFAGE